MDWALIGASNIAATAVIPALRANGQGLRHVVSGLAAHAAAFAAAHDIPSHGTDLAAALADPKVQAVYVSSTNEKHFSQAMAAIAAGKHVLCEKPLAMSVTDAARMVQAAEDAGLVFATNHHLRCSGSHRAARALVQAGRLGKVLSLRIFHAVHLPAHLQGWRINDAAAGGGVIPDITVHDADCARFLLGEDPAEVVAQMAATGMGRGVEDSAMSVWSMPSGAMVFAHESFSHPFAGTGFEIHGSEGSLFARDVMRARPGGEAWLQTEAGREAISFPLHDLYTQGVAEFVAATEGKGQPAATGWDGVKSLAVALAVREAARSGARTAVDYGGAK